MLEGKKVGVLGYNARPLACSCKKAGAEVYVSDFWGDSDLVSCCSEWVAVLSPIPGKRQRETKDEQENPNLVSQFINSFSAIDFDFILVGSGFDGRARELEPIAKRWGLSGNSIEKMMKARKLSLMEDLVSDTKIKIPEYETIKDFNELTDAVSRFGFPCVLKPLASGGGSGIKLLRSHRDLQSIHDWSKSDEPQTRIIQRYIPGIDASVSLLGTGTSTTTVSINGQLIGIPSAGRNCDFVYCGNYIPFQKPAKTIRNLKSGAESICTSLELRGSNGIDVIIDDEGDIWLMEINPRFQGTLEMLESAASISIVNMHLEAIDGYLPEKIPSFSPSVKMIVYAKKNGTLPDLKRYPNTVDRSPKGVLVKRGEPVCSVIETGESLQQCYHETISTALKIQEAL